MKSFWARKEYYINDFRAIQDWFGNRGIPIKEGDLKEWCYDGHFLYFTCAPSAPYEITPCDDDGNVMACVLDSHCYECYEEMDWRNSPFAHILDK